MEKGAVFFGFKEGDMSFHPTFKVLREKELKYLEQRVPAYCDRILWKSMPNVANDVVQQNLEPLTWVGTSDHKPVRGNFTIKIKKNTETAEKLNLSLKFHNIKCEGLDAKDIGGASDPYIVFFSPDGIIKSKKSLKSQVVMANLNPEWSEKGLPIVPLSVSSLENVCESVISFIIYDKDMTSSDDLLGAAEIDLSGGKLEENVHFEAGIHRHGRKAGSVSGQYSVVVTV
eukprot:m.132851 g.132851  ORF g.132851 m.132851 type:complete len:229 (+) comp13094_c1_seq2:671-1357(+)